MEIDLHNIIDEVTQIQREASKIFKNYESLGIEKNVVSKGKNFVDYTTAIDVAVEKQIKEKLLGLIFCSEYLGEETDSHNTKSRYRWIQDPLDGTAVFALGGEYYSNSIALVDKEGNSGKGSVVFGSVYQPMIGRQFVRTSSGLIIREKVLSLEGKEEIRERIPIPSKSKGFPEYQGCSFGTSKYFKNHPRIKDKLDNVFLKREVPSLKREYSMINARPASGSSALFCCDIAEGKKHFALLFFQKAWDLAVGALYARDAGCPINIFNSEGNISNESDLEHLIVNCDKDTLLNIGIYANDKVKEDVIERFNYAS